MMNRTRLGQRLWILVGCKEERMKKPCETCKHQELTARDEPCRNCVNLEGYEPREITKDSKQIYSELLMMYIKALNNAIK